MFIPPQNVVYFLMLPFLVHKIFTFYINGVLNCKCPDAEPLCSFLHSPVTSSLSGSNIRLNTLFSNTLSLRFSLDVRDQVSHPYDAPLPGYFEVYERKGRNCVQFLPKYYLIFQITSTDLPLSSGRHWRRMFFYCEVLTFSHRASYI